MTLMNIDSVVETDFEKVRPDMDLGEMVKVISQAKRNLFPVCLLYTSCRISGNV